MNFRSLFACKCLQPIIISAAIRKKLPLCINQITTFAAQLQQTYQSTTVFNKNQIKLKN